MCHSLEKALTCLGSDDLKAVEEAILDLIRHAIKTCPDCQREYAAFVRGGFPALKAARAENQGEEQGEEEEEPRRPWLMDLARHFQATDLAEARAQLEELRSLRKGYRQAEHELEEILATSPEHRKEKIERATRRFRSPYLAALLVERSKAHIFDDAQEALALAELAVLVAGNIPRDKDPAEEADMALARALAYQGNALRVVRRLPEAEKTLDQALGNARENCPADQPLLAEILSLQASLLQDQGRAQESLPLLEQAISIRKVGGDRHQVGRMLLQRARAFDFLERPDQALVAVLEAQGLVDAKREPVLEVILADYQVNLLLRQRRFEEAETLLAAKSEMFAKFPQPRIQSRLLWLQGLLHREKGTFAQAEGTLREVRQGYLARNAGYDAALVSIDLAKALAMQGKTEELKALARDMYAVFQSHEVHAEAARALATFQEAAYQEKVTLDLLEKLSTYLNRARYNPELKFELAA